MRFKLACRLVLCSLLLLLSACSSTDNETALVDLFATASQDLIAINFPAGATEDIISIDTFVDYSIEGLKSNGVDTVPVSNVSWSLSAGAASTIDQNGRLSTGSVAEVISVIAKVGILSTSQTVTVSAAKFDRVVQLNSTPVLVNMCQSQQIKPIGSYLNDDGSEEIRPVDNSTINNITWLIRNQEDDLASQRAFIKTENNQAELQALAAGNVIIQAQALSLSSGSTITSTDFAQTLDNNLNSLKLCDASDTDLTACLLSTSDITVNNVISLTAIGNYQATDGTNFNQNISAFSKWGVDNSSNASITFSTDRQQLDVTGTTASTTANISVACGNIEQTVTDSDIKNGAALNEAVTCASGNINCLRTSAAINVNAEAVLNSLGVSVNTQTLIDNTALALSSQPSSLTFKVTSNFSDGSSQDVTTDTTTSYSNTGELVIIEVAGSPGIYTVLGEGNAEVQITYQGLTFIAKITIPLRVKQ